jgi:serine protease
MIKEAGMERTKVVELARSRQAQETLPGEEGARALRIILEFDKRREPPEVVADIRQKLGLGTTAALLFAQPDGGGIDPALSNYVAVTVDGVDQAAIQGQSFELSYAIAEAAGAATAEPELGTNFFVMPREDGLEGAMEVLGCWVPETQDIALDQPYWALDKINTRAAWDEPPAPGGKSKGEGIVVFQPDTGVADHDELEPGMLDLNRAHDFVADKPGAADPLNYEGNPGHGTGTASVVASRVDGKIAGSAPLATLVPLRALESVVVFDHGRVAAAVEYARQNGANVITMSLGGAWSSALRAAIDRAIADGIIVLAAAGNCVKLVVWPARYEEVIAVGGTNVRDEPWRGTCSGTAVDISAPAEFVPRAKRNPPDGGSPHAVAGGQGTSFAVAITAGVAALWLAHHTPEKVKAAVPPGSSIQQLFVSLLRNTARRPAGFDTENMGAGIADALALIKAPLVLPREEAPFAAADPHRSLRTALARDAGAGAVAAPIGEKRFAAELSHHAVTRALAKSCGSAEGVIPEGAAAPVSRTLREALNAAGTDLSSIGLG